ncbi:MAG: hypothetical protein JWL81_2397 [Verrucomicrobiales bacterium]|nr:hypothetical protein [Verrucomicrobiales bacterium]
MRPEIILTSFALAVGSGFISWNLAAPEPAKPSRPRASLSISETPHPPAATQLPAELGPVPSTLPWDQRLLQAANPTLKPESQAHALACLLSCISEADTPHRLLELAQFADDLCMTPHCLRQVSSQLAKHPLSVVERVLMTWTSQAGAEILFRSMPDPLKGQLSKNMMLLGWIFGSRSDGMLAALPKPESPAESLARVAALFEHDGIITQTEGVFGGTEITQSLERVLEQMDPADHPALAEFLNANWSRVSRGARLPLFKQLSKHLSPTLLHNLARTVARSTASDLVLQEYGRAHGRTDTNVDGFIAEMDTWPSETSKRILVIGYIDQRQTLRPEEARQIAEATADAGMQKAIFEAVR